MQSRFAIPLDRPTFRPIFRSPQFWGYLISSAGFSVERVVVWSCCSSGPSNVFRCGKYFPHVLLSFGNRLTFQPVPFLPNLEYTSAQFWAGLQRSARLWAYLNNHFGNLAFSLSKLLHWFGAWGRPESRHPFSDRHFCPQPCIPDKTEDMKSLIIHHKERAVFRLNESALERLFISPIINIASNVNLSHFIAWPFAIAQTHSGWV